MHNRIVFSMPNLWLPNFVQFSPTTDGQCVEVARHRLGTEWSSLATV